MAGFIRASSNAPTNSKWPARPEFARIVRFSYLTPLVLLPILFAVFVLQLRDLSSDYESVDHADLVRVHLARVLRMLVDSETGVRGFQLSGDREFLQPYQGATSDIEAEFNELARLVSNDVDQNARVEQLRKGYHEWLVTARQMIQERETAGGNEDRQLNLAGKRKVDALREKFEEIREAEVRIRQQRDLHTSRTATAALLGGSIATLLTGLVLVFATKRQVLAISTSYENLLQQGGKSEKELQRLNRMLRIKSACNQELVRSKTEKELLEAICGTIVAVGGFRIAWIGFAEQDADKNVRPVAVAGDDEGYIACVHVTWDDSERGQGPTGRAIRFKEVQVVRDTDRDASFGLWREGARQRGFASTVAVPLFTANTVLGSLNVYAGESDAFDARENRLLTEIAADLSYGIQSLRAKREKEETEAQFRTLIETAADGIFISNADGRYILANSSGARMLGYSVEEFCRLSVPDVLAEEEISRLEPVIARLAAGEVVRSEWRFRSKDGSFFDGEVIARQLPNGHHQSFLRDITERKQIETELLERSNLLSESQRIAHIGSWKWDIPTDGIRWSDEAYRIYGLTKESFIPEGESFLRLIVPEDRPLMQEWIRACVAGERPGELEFRAVLPSGDIRTLSGRGDLRLSADGTPESMVGTVQDITERKRAESEVLVRTRQQSALADLGLFAVSCTDLSLVFQRACETVSHTLGAELTKVLELLPGAENLLLRAGIGWHEGLVGHAKVSTGRSSQAGYTLACVGPVIVHDAKIETRFSLPPLLQDHGVVSGVSVPIRGANDLLGVLGAHTRCARAFTQDDGNFLQSVANLLAQVVDRERAETKLRQQSLIIENSSEFIGIASPDGNLIYLNNAGRQLVGLDLNEDVTEFTIADFVVPQDLQAASTIVSTLLEKKSWKGEFCLKHFPSGHGIPVFQYAFAITNPTSGDVSMLANISHDIRERKQVEQALRMQGEQLRALTVRLQQVREEERTTVARDLHDQIGQILTAVKMDISSLAKQLSPGQQDRLKATTQLIHEGVQSIRKICTELRPGILDDLGLAAAIEWQATEFASRAGIPCKVSVPSAELDLDGASATAVFRIFQEALTNVARHAEASKVSSSLFLQGDDLILTVQDDGKGIRENESSRSLGILGMKERAQACGGEVKVSGVSGRGTTVTVRIPMRRKAETPNHHAYSNC